MENNNEVPEDNSSNSVNDYIETLKAYIEKVKTSRAYQVITAIVIFLMLFSFISGGEDKYVDAVKNGSFDDYDKMRTIGQAFEENKYIENIEWSSSPATNGRVIVSAKCKTKDLNEPIKKNLIFGYRPDLLKCATFGMNLRFNFLIDSESENYISYELHSVSCEISNAQIYKNFDVFISRCPQGFNGLTRDFIDTVYMAFNCEVGDPERLDEFLKNLYGNSYVPPVMNM